MSAGVRTVRQDTWFRRNASRLLNMLRERTTRIHMTDQGCMLRAYSRQIIEAINQCEEVNTFIPALAYTFANKPAEIPVEHEDRAAGTTKYSLYKLMRLNFDLVTGFSLAPLQAFSLVGFVLAVASTGAVVFQIIHRLVRGEAAEGMFRSVTDACSFSCLAWCYSALVCWVSTSAASTRKCCAGRASSSAPCSKNCPTPSRRRSLARTRKLQQPSASAEHS